MTADTPPTIDAPWCEEHKRTKHYEPLILANGAQLPMTDLITNRPPCTGCHRPTRSATRPNDPGRPHAGNGLCDTCYHRRRRHVIQPPGTARARQRAPGQFAADYTELKEMGVHGDEALCRRMGMKPLSFRRAYERAKKAGAL